MTPRASSTSGNMLVYILGAIFLLGLLIVLLKGSFQEGTGIDPEKTLMRVNEIKRFGAEAERGIGYILQNGYSESDLRFAHPDNTTFGDITSIPGRQLFSPDGGGVELRETPSDILTQTSVLSFSARNAIEGVGSTCEDTACTELVMTIPHVTKEFCVQINRLNNITNPGGDPPQDTDGFSLDYALHGTYVFTQTLNTAGDELVGKTEGCFEGGDGDTAPGRYYYYRVLLAR